MPRILITTSIFIFSVAVATTGYAQLTQNLLIGNPKAMALGNAVTADPPGTDSIHFNPAGLARLKGRQYELKFVVADVVIDGEFQLNDPNVIQQYDSLGIEDPLANSRSSIDKFAVFLPGVGVTKMPVAAAPLGGVSFNEEGSKFTFANSVYAPMLLGLARKDSSPAAVYGSELGITRLTYFSPSVGYEVSDNLAIGMSVGFSFYGAGVNLQYRAPNDLLKALGIVTESICREDGGGPFVYENPWINFCGGEVGPFVPVFQFEVELADYFSPTVNLGLLWDATEWLTFGIAYQSEAKDNLKGKIDVNLDPGLVGLLGGIDDVALLNAVIRGIGIPEDGKIRSTGHINLVTPQHLAMGLSVRVLPQLKLNIDVKWTETSVWDELDFRFDEQIGFLSLLSFIGIEGVEPDAIVIPRGYNDTINWGIGFEYQYSSQLDLRFGYEPRKTGIPDDKRDFLIPVGDVNLFGTGFSYKLSRTSSFDFTLAFAKSEEFIKSGTSTNGNDHSRFNNFVYNPTAGLDTKSVVDISVIEMSYRTHF